MPRERAFQVVMTAKSPPWLLPRAGRSGERVTQTVNGDPVADIVPHGPRSRWLSGTHLRDGLVHRSADADLTKELVEIVGQTLDEL